jgi:hypothetical protein
MMMGQYLKLRQKENIRVQGINKLLLGITHRTIPHSFTLIHF